MKTLPSVLLLALVAQTAYCAEPSSFESYRGLSSTERARIASEAPAKLQAKYSKWDHILAMGGQWWNGEEARAISKAKDFSGLLNLINVNVNVWAGYYRLKQEALQANGLTADEKKEIETLWARLNEVDHERYKDLWWYLIRLADTPEARDLDKKANALYFKWHGRFDENPSYTEDAMREMDVDVKVIRDRMRQLPALSAREIESMLGRIFEQGDNP
jgi:hypothetical protein